MGNLRFLTLHMRFLCLLLSIASPAPLLPFLAIECVHGLFSIFEFEK
jgi:hypothetical protein